MYKTLKNYKNFPNINKKALFMLHPAYFKTTAMRH